MASQGWECPKCGMVHAPWVPSCRRCKPDYIDLKPPPFPPEVRIDITSPKRPEGER